MNRLKLYWVVAVVFAVFGTVLRAVPGMRFSGDLFGCAAGAIAVYAFFDALCAKKRWAVWGKRAMLVLLIFGMLLFAAMESLVLRDNSTDADGQEVSCVIILGAGVNGTQPSLMLRSRLDAALMYLEDRPEIPVICSGGQGAGEDITEAECMARWLMLHGIEEKRIWKEERSTSTAENFDFSTEVMLAHGVDPTDSFAFVTNDYHVARARRIAGVPWAYAVAAELPDGFFYYRVLQANYYIREAFAMAKLLMIGG